MIRRRRPLRSRSGLRPGSPPSRRARLRPVSPRKTADSDLHAWVRELVFARDRHTCRLAAHGEVAALGGVVPACLGQLTVHHIRKVSQGGPYLPHNLVTLCAWHNDWLETARGADWGAGHGLVARRVGPGELDDVLAGCWALMRQYGIVHWGPDA